MTKLEELMELNKAVDTIIAETNKENKNTEKEIEATEIKLWNRMWDDIDEWYNKGYINIVANIKSVIYYPYKYYSGCVLDSHSIKFYKDNVYMDFSGCHDVIKRSSYYDAKTQRTDGSKRGTALLISWNEIKIGIEDIIANTIADNIKTKTKQMQNKIDKDNATLNVLKKLV